eukprot:CAMPEP_0194194648 /NCGR_PEP_ID=MMETSP0154-20130528/75696_1 /TAXON_ID=1049557 /ORGANISM="Thalassiothrix antarctica, Strain L6-D1" /LENGTH=511 /DNA_ID=CAMNT_0038919097 /DNA_START=2967 /DNA_END=4502 /DNA_ORIENTATION=+
MNASALLIQKQHRGYVVRKHVSLLNSNAVLLQTQYRGYLTRKHYEFIPKYIVVIQKLYRGMKAKKESERRKNDKLREESCIKIQTQLRRVAAKKEIKCRQYDQCQKELREKSCIKIQAQLRRGVAKKEILELIQEKACVKIQAQFRISPAKRTMEQRQIELIREKACVKIQARFRISPAKRTMEQRQIELIQEKACIKIQAEWRRFWLKWNYLYFIADLITAQSVIRRWLACHRLKQKEQKKETRASAPHKLVSLGCCPDIIISTYAKVTAQEYNDHNISMKVVPPMVCTSFTSMVKKLKGGALLEGYKNNTPTKNRLRNSNHIKTLTGIINAHDSNQYVAKRKVIFQKSANISSKEPAEVCVDNANEEKLKNFIDLTAESNLKQKDFLDTVKLSLGLASDRSSNSPVSINNPGKEIEESKDDSSWGKAVDTAISSVVSTVVSIASVDISNRSCSSSSASKKLHVYQLDGDADQVDIEICLNDTVEENMFSLWGRRGLEIPSEFLKEKHAC